MGRSQPDVALRHDGGKGTGDVAAARNGGLADGGIASDKVQAVSGWIGPGCLSR